MQCEDFLAEHPDWKVVESEDTAWSAKDIQEGKIMGRAAICSSLAAEVYNLDVLSPGIETNKRNFTRFLILSDRWNAEQYNTTSEINKASIVLTTQHTSGALAQVLSVLSYFQNNLSKIQSKIGRAHV